MTTTRWTKTTQDRPHLHRIHPPLVPVPLQTGQAAVQKLPGNHPHRAYRRRKEAYRTVRQSRRGSRGQSRRRSAVRHRVCCSTCFALSSFECVSPASSSASFDLVATRPHLIICIIISIHYATTALEPLSSSAAKSDWLWSFQRDISTPRDTERNLKSSCMTCVYANRQCQIPVVAPIVVNVNVFARGGTTGAHPASRRRACLEPHALFLSLSSSHCSFSTMRPIPLRLVRPC